jgi:hypothetical protein
MFWQRPAWSTGLTRWSHAEAGLRPISASPNGEDRSNAFAADNSTEWTGGARNLAPETGLDDKTINSYLFALKADGIDSKLGEDLDARGHADHVGDNG